MIYDCIVLGVGGIGSAALYSAARKGWNVLGIDRFGSAHDRGSSHGRTRIIRTVYFEHPNYVPLAMRAWECWSDLQGKSKVKLVSKTGLLQVGEPSGRVMQGLLASAAEHDLPVQKISADEAMHRFPAFKIDDEQQCIFEEDAGYLLIENCVAQLIRLAKESGAQFAANTLVDRVLVNSDSTIKLVADGGQEFLTERLVIAVGSWASDLLGALPFDIQVVRKQQQWFQLDRIDIKDQNGFPAFLIEDKEGCYYGFPEIDYLGMKVAEHSGGQNIDGPLEINRECSLADLQGAEAFLDRRLKFSRRRLVHHSVCMYSTSQDSHFIIDYHGESDKIVFAAGLSGHGFKFAPVLGQHLIDMLDGKSESIFDFLKMGQRSLCSVESN